MMRISPIPFSAPMIRAILREIEAPGTGKTQTRRVLKSQPSSHAQIYRVGSAWEWRDGTRGGSVRIPYTTGDRLWVKEAWRFPAIDDFYSPSEVANQCLDAGYIRPWAAIIYEADRHKINWPSHFGDAGRLRNARFMPRWASRITLIVTDVRVQRLQDISEEDAKAEGLSPDPVSGRYWCGMDEAGPITAKSPITAYAWLWNSLHGEDAWTANPWVAAYTFRPVLGNVDTLQDTA